ncbi:MAG: hypothetical protein GC184_07410 [Rhizobiales bacterium]|nr:hypothetical protein [Hyphomicrobiales bacterium]
MIPNLFASAKTGFARRFSRHLASLLFLGVLVVAGSTQLHAELNDEQQGIAAIVNDEIISTYDLLQRVKLVMVSSGIPNTPENIARVQPQILRSLIDERLKMQEAKRTNITVSDDEIDKAIAQIASRSNMTEPEVIEFLNKGGVEKSALVNQIRADLAWNKLVQQQFGGLVSVGDSDIDEVLRRMQEESNQPRYKVSEILLTYDLGQENEIMAGATRLVEQMRQGAPFEAVARQFSQSASAANGGDIGWVHASELPDAVADVVKNMYPGTISDPIKTRNGLYIISLGGKQSGTGADAMNDQYQLVQIVFPLSPDAPLSAVELRIKQTKEFMAAGATCENVSEAAGKYVGAVATPPKSVIASQLDPKLRQALSPMKVGDITEPLRSERGIEMVMLCGHIADEGGLPSRDAIDNNLYSQQISMMSRRHLRDLRRDAVIVVR